MKAEPMAVAALKNQAPQLTPLPQQEAQPPVLSEATQRVVLALARFVMPQTGQLPEPGERLVRRINDFVARAPRLVRLGYLAMLWSVELLALLFHGKTLSRLDDARAWRYLERWHRSAFFVPRVMLRGVVTPLKIAHFADPQISRSLGYDPPPPAPPEVVGDWFANVLDAEDCAGEALRCDVVVVGSGPGGAVMATRLAERGLRVAMVEEGRYHFRSEFTRRPYDMMQRLYRDVGMTVALGLPGIPLPLGQTVGGTSTINSGTCFRVPDRVVREWRDDYGLHHLTPELLRPHFEEVERFLHVGPVAPQLWGNVPKLIRRGCDALGWSHRPLNRNASDCKASGVCCFGCPTNAKRSMNVSYVPRALTAGARIVTRARAERVLLHGGRAVGVEARTPGGGTLTLRSDAVVVACGTILTPVFLRRNGLGRRSGQLGRNLTIHPAAKVAALFDEEVRSWEGVPQGYCIDHFHEQGLMFEGASMPPEYGAIGLPQLGPRFMDIMQRYAHLGQFGYMVEDESRGRVLRGPEGRPVLVYNVCRADVEKLKRGAKILGRVFFEAGARVVLPPVAGLEELHDPRELERLDDPRIKAQDFELTGFHPLGTCRMGARPQESVLDPGLELWDVDGLFVTDGSVFPTSLGVNPQMTIMAMASWGAERVAQRVGGASRWSA